MSVTIKYSAFALVATAVNLIGQYISLLVYAGYYDLYLAMGVGTLVGLVTKYILDRKYIFYYRIKNKIEETQKFILYSATGVFTTLVFWSFEIFFDTFFHYDSSKFIGAVLGLSIGYTLKYYLDKRWVFIDKNNG